MTNELKSLSKDTVRLIGSSQVITSVFSVVKELVENSIDAESTSVDIKLENFGLDKIEVRDNGTGIKSGNIPLVAKRYHTSKISSFGDLEHLSTYGFRGEALGSLCAVSNLSVTSKTAVEDVSHMFMFDHHGNIVSDQPSHLGQGTTIIASHLFKNMPVRRQFYNTVKKKKEELKKIEGLMMAYGAIRPDVRLSFKNNKDVIWQKSVMADTRSALLSIMGRNVMNQLQREIISSEDKLMTIEAFLPKARSDSSITSRSTGDRCFIAINHRPVVMKDAEKIIRRHYNNHHQCEGRYPVCHVTLTLPSTDLDVNIDPNKTKVMLHQKKTFVTLLTTLLEDIYGPMKTIADDNDSIINLNESDIVNDTNSTNISPDSSFGSPSTDGKNENFNGVKGTKNTNSKSTKGMTSLKSYGQSKGVISNGEEKDEEKSDNLNTNVINSELKISFYDANKDKQNADADENTPIELGDSVFYPRTSTQNDTKVQDLAATTEQNLNDDTDMGSDILATQTNKGNFDIIDDELELLLKTQQPPEKHHNVSEESLSDLQNSVDISLQGNFGEICRNVKNVKEGSEENNGLLPEYEETIQRCNNTLNVTDNMLDKNNLNKENNENNSLLDWSKGTKEIQENGQIIQPVQLLAAGSHMTNKRPLSPSGDCDVIGVTPPAKKKVSSILADQPRLYECIGKSPGEKFTVGFVAFSKEYRPKVVEDNPDADYDDITRIVRQKWDILPDLDKQQYGDKGKVDVDQLKKKAASSVQRKLSAKIDRRVLPVKGLPTIKDQLLAVNRQKGDVKTTVVIKSVKVTFSLNQIQQKYKTGTKQSQSQGTKKNFSLIGPLKYYNGWVCFHGNTIQVMNPHRIEETLLHQQLMENHVISAKTLEHPIRLNKSNVGGPGHYQALVDMIPTDTHQTYVHIEDKRVTDNGFQIRCHADQDGNPVLELVSMATCMPQYGIADLHEVLENIIQCSSITLGDSRPLKVKYYLQGEAVRMVRQRPIHKTLDDMEDILDQLDVCLKSDCVTCLHNKPFLHPVYDMDNIPETQTQSNESSGYMK